MRPGDGEWRDTGERGRERQRTPYFAFFEEYFMLGTRYDYKVFLTNMVTLRVKWKPEGLLQ